MLFFFKEKVVFGREGVVSIILNVCEENEAMLMCVVFLPFFFPVTLLS